MRVKYLADTDTTLVEFSDGHRSKRASSTRASLLTWTPTVASSA
jgi:hypothetical protein